jgi:hypothetical protein
MEKQMAKASKSQSCLLKPSDAPAGLLQNDETA